MKPSQDELIDGHLTRAITYYQEALCDTASREQAIVDVCTRFGSRVLRHLRADDANRRIFVGSLLPYAEREQMVRARLAVLLTERQAGGSATAEGD